MTCSKDMHGWKVTKRGKNCSHLCAPVCSQCFRFIKLWLISVEINLCTNRIMLHIIIGRIWNSYQHLFMGDLSFSLLKTHLLVFMIQYINIIKKWSVVSPPYVLISLNFVFWPYLPTQSVKDIFLSNLWWSRVRFHFPAAVFLFSISCLCMCRHHWCNTTEQKHSACISYQRAHTTAWIMSKFMLKTGFTMGRRKLQGKVHW